MSELGVLIGKYGGMYSSMLSIVNLFLIVDVIPLLFLKRNKRKKAIHDVIANTFVISRDSSVKEKQ